MKKRYQIAEQLEALIDQEKQKQRDNAVYIERLRDTYTNIFKWMAVQDVNWDKLSLDQKEHYRNEHARAIFAKEEADKAHKTHSKYETRLNRLKATLAALNTETFPFLEDKSVTLQKVS